MINSWMCHSSDICVCGNADVNECEDTRLCQGGQCTNTIGSYSCLCPSGHELMEGTSCRGIYTHTHEICNLWLAIFLWLTTCWHIDTAVWIYLYLFVTDIDECLTIVGICGEGNCLNTKGSYSCTCPDGFTSTDRRSGCQGIITHYSQNTNINGKSSFMWFYELYASEWDRSSITAR